MEFFKDPSTYFNALISLIIGVLTGVIASYLFLKHYLQKLKPSIIISDFICKVELEGKTHYLFKFINRTKYELFDVTLDLSSYKPIGVLQGQNLRKTTLKLKTTNISFIPPYENKNDQHHTYAVIINTQTNIEEFLTGDNSDYIRLTIIAKHSLSGLNGIFTKDFHTNQCIAKSNFKFGDSIELNNSK
ncbi:hypothetical protein [Myroides odoratimimus]|uniref:hypothetical protein n=1 Tax=Myroides odoratimimus TaxID=76832 RepID=UPI0029BFC4DA|nr:hypothetical protein [Myroides odoratimimus]MDX4973680.1 hypothetical protein [Myroides odoratimimus]